LITAPAKEIRGVCFGMKVVGKLRSGIGVVNLVDGTSLGNESNFSEIVQRDDCSLAAKQWSEDSDKNTEPGKPAPETASAQQIP
jgi:hypothetical protein